MDLLKWFRHTGGVTTTPYLEEDEVPVLIPHGEYVPSSDFIKRDKMGYALRHIDSLGAENAKLKNSVRGLRSCLEKHHEKNQHSLDYLNSSLNEHTTDVLRVSK